MARTPSPGGLSRRDFLAAAGATIALPLFPGGSLANVPAGEALHGLSAFGDLKYPEGFGHFDYANPDAPKGGTFNFQPGYWYFNQNVLTFNTLNAFVRTGDAPPRMEVCFDTLMVRAYDEPDALYGLLAEHVTLSEDRNSFTFRLRPQARFHDGTPLTAEDAAFSYMLLKEKGHPQLALPLTELNEAVAEDEHTLRLTFSGRQAPRNILTVTSNPGYPVFSKTFIEENGFDSSRLVPLLGSGPYKVGRFSAGRYIEYDRVEDYWARDLGPMKGFNHFGRIRIDFYRDRNAGFEAFKKGDTLWREEFTARTWTTGYDFPAVREGRVVQTQIPQEKRPLLYGFVPNQRREQFRDARAREAISLCFDFEWTNRNLFYDVYTRSHSFFQNSPYMAEGLPSPEEQALLDRFRGQAPEAAFGEAVIQPVSDGSGRDRVRLREARRLLMEAGWTPRDGILHNEKGTRFTLEYLVRDEIFLRTDASFTENLRAIGIDASIRLVDASQYQSRQTGFDFDMISMAIGMEATPDADGLDQISHSRSAGVEGSYNFSGTADPVIDALIGIAGQARTRDELTVALKVLDRVLRARRDWIPNWHSANHRIAHWDMFGYGDNKPDYFFPVESLWWHDAEKAKAIGKA
ncbi:extracellular solute-binding protein [Nitratireductor pacificus]|uniref:Twin-arginine translocation pathway signal n=1 Tax=Nitratireductor pacificus pht-3B TaxID=391937 RepID=K2LNZ0_9HYPH|nr:extracellular solute-binding protein [Nitratireductor pacificus]EKF19484.1 twin-arginine translocation pathway signal [Nitratireductor pacificus pht-3B]